MFILTVYYANGKIDEALNNFYRSTLFPKHGITTYIDLMFDQRNIAWVESGKIQKNCVHGNKCLIFVGIAHLDESDNALIKLLKEQG